MAKRVPRTRGDGKLTESMFMAMIKNNLRKLHLYWNSKTVAKNKAKTGGTVINPNTDRPNVAYECAICHGEFMGRHIDIDHLEPFVPIGMTWEDMFKTMTLEDIVNRMYCESDGYRALCEACHVVCTNEENEMRRLAK
jgi:hypothetical protein